MVRRQPACVRQVLGELKRKYSVDGTRVYLAGSANGALMAYRMACDHAELIAGVLVHGAGMDQRDVDACAPARPLHILHVQGTEDFFDIENAVTMLEVWADMNGCAAADGGKALDGPLGEVGARPPHTPHPSTPSTPALARSPSPPRGSSGALLTCCAQLPRRAPQVSGVWKDDAPCRRPTSRDAT